MRLFHMIAAGMGLALVGGAALTQGPAPQPAIAPTRAVAPAAPAVPAAGAPLERADVESWLDGFMPYALARGDIAGGVVVIVKDGQVLLQKGYGFSDVEKRTPVSPESTLFRPGSVSKLLTWTAVMQLVERGKLNLDRDVNAYLDFKIPPYDGKPITLRHVLTHTAGFEESARHLMGSNPKGVMPLDQYLKGSLPERVFAPGTTPAYSNYATALAGYIVARVSGLSFDDYIDSQIFRPIGMTRSSFRQPLPKPLQPLMSKGYPAASQDAEPFEMVVPAPAGSLSATGADMGRFMLAHLNEGRGLMSPATTRMMHSSTLTVLPQLNRMALGFYEQNVNGRRVVAHGGDTQWFHSYLWLFPDDGVGMFVSVNSGGKEGASGAVRTALFNQFADRYFPAPLGTARVDEATARKHATMMTGTYSNSRGAKTNFLRITEFLGQPTMGVDAKGALTAPAVTGLAGQPRKWVEIAPFVWRDANTGERIAAQVENGQVVRWSFDAVSPFMMFDRVPWHLNSTWLLPAFATALGVVLLTAIAWPAGAIARRRYKAALPFEGRALQAHRLTKGFAWLTIVTLALWTTLITVMFSDFTKLGGPMDWLLYTVQILSPIAFFGLLGLAAWSLWLVWKGRRGWFARLWSVLLLLAAIIILWVALAFNLIGFGTTY